MSKLKYTYVQDQSKGNKFFVTKNLVEKKLYFTNDPEEVKTNNEEFKITPQNGDLVNMGVVFQRIEENCIVTVSILIPISKNQITVQFLVKEGLTLDEFRELMKLKKMERFAHFAPILEQAISLAKPMSNEQFDTLKAKGINVNDAKCVCANGEEKVKCEKECDENKAKVLAERLNGRQEAEEIKAEDLRYAVDNGLIIMYGSGKWDDEIHLRGAICEDFTEGVLLLIPKGKKVQLHDEDEPKAGKWEEGSEKEAVAIQLKDEADVLGTRVEGQFINLFWQFKTDITHHTFNIYKAEEKYCVGIVISEKDLEETFNMWK